MRVQIPAYTDRWMMGDRYGVVTRVAKTGTVSVRLDKSGLTKKFHRCNVTEIDGARRR